MPLNKLTIAGLEIYEFAGAWTDGEGIDGPHNGTYYAVEPYGNAPCEGAPEYQDLEITLPGLDGVGVKRLGFRGRPIYATIVFVGTNKFEVEAYKNTFLSAVTALASFTIKLPSGEERPSCRIVHGSASNGQWVYIGGRLCLVMPMGFRQFRLS